VSAGSGGEIAVMALGHGPPRLVRTVPLPGSMSNAFGMALTHDGRLLLVAGYTATAVMSVRALEDGHGDPVIGVLATPGPASSRSRYRVMTGTCSLQTRPPAS
jgi:6-phosphogluconolactonase (cycloisomerase 2 family)